MKQQTFLFLLTLLMSMVGAKAFAHDIEVANADGVTIYYYYWDYSQTQLAVTYRGNDYDSYTNEYTGNVVIPSSVSYYGKTYPVTSIGYGAFRGCSGLTSVTIPSGVWSISDEAFYGCSGLTSVTIPSSVTSIGFSAFSGCSGLSSIIVANDNKVYDSRNNCNAIIKTQSNELIAGCKNTIIPNTVTSIGSSAFYGCSGLTSVTIPSGVKSIGDYAFKGCNGLTSVEFHCSEIGSWFSGLESIKEIVIGEEVTSIGSSAFSGCNGLTSVEFHCSNIGNWFSGFNSIKGIYIGKEVTSIGESAFSGCSGLTSVAIPSSVISVGNSAFKNCSFLDSLTISSGVQSIGSESFSGCNSLDSVNIPQSVTSIGSDAFKGTALFANAPYGVFYIDNWACGHKGTINNGTEVNIKDGTYGLAAKTLCFDEILSVNLPKSLKFVGANAFSTKVKTITITSETLVQIGGHSFTSDNRVFVPTGTMSSYKKDATWRKCTIYENTDVSKVDNAIYLTPAEVRLGQEPVLEINLKNAEKATAYSFDIQFDGKVMIAEDALSGRHTNHTRTFTDRGNGMYSFAVLSSTSDSLKGSDGAVRSIRLRFTDDTPVNVPVTISNAVYSRPDGTSVKMGNVSTTVNVHDFAKGDVNGDGDVDIADAVCVVKRIVGDTDAVYKVRAADTNADNSVDIGDAVTIVNMIVGHKGAPARRARLNAQGASAAQMSFGVERLSLPQNDECSLPVSFSMTGAEGCSGWQFSLQLPDGVDFVTDENGNVVYTVGDCYDEAPLIVLDKNGNTLKAGCFTSGAKPINSDNGVLVTFRIRPARQLVIGEVMEGSLTDARISTSKGVSMRVSDADFEIYIDSPLDTYTVIDEASIVQPQAAEHVDVRVKRTIQAGVWSTICLPFSMTAEQLKSAFGDDVQLADFQGTVSEVDGEDNLTGINVHFKTVTELEANRPYIIKAQEDMSEFIVDAVNLTPHEEDAYVEFDNGKTGSRRVVFSGFYGTYHDNTLLDENTLYMNDGKFFYSDGQQIMKGFRAYFDFLDVFKYAERAFPVEQIRLVIDDQATEGVDDAFIQTNNGKDLQKSEVYDLQGRRFVTPGKGLYIMKGKKVNL